MNKQSIHVLAITTTLLLASVSVAYAQFSVLHAFTGGADGKNPYYGTRLFPDRRSTAQQPGGQRWRAGLFGRYGRHELQRSAYVYEHLTGRLRTARLGCSERLDPLWNDLLRGQRHDGTVFAVNVDGTGYQTVLSFGTAASYKPYGSVTVSGSTLYGMTYYSGSGLGSIYSVGTNGNGYTLLHSFTGGTTDGSRPLGGSLMLSDSTLFGMTAHGGPGTSGSDGVAFAIELDGSGYNDLVNFNASPSIGANPYGSLTLVGSKLYGMTRIGGSANEGTIFSMDTDGSDYTTLYSFSGGTAAGLNPADGANPYGSLTSDGGLVLYGTTKFGGSANDGTVFEIDTDGSGFNVAPFVHRHCRRTQPGGRSGPCQRHPLRLDFRGRRRRRRHTVRTIGARAVDLGADRGRCGAISAVLVGAPSASQSRLITRGTLTGIWSCLTRVLVQLDFVLRNLDARRCPYACRTIRVLPLLPSVPGGSSLVAVCAVWDSTPPAEKRDYGGDVGCGLCVERPCLGRIHAVGLQP